MNPIAIAIKGKGILNVLRRGMSIAGRYGITPDKLDQALALFATILRQFECSATFPITTVALQRNPHIIRKYQAQGIEFAIHGYRHVDYSRLSIEEQSAHLQSAQQVFAQAGVQAQGFRCPYLRSSPATLQALSQHGLAYDSSQALAWNVLNGKETPAYLRVLDFYGTLPARHYPSLPSLQGDLVCIPYSVPDDEAIVERLSLASPDEGSTLWQAILQRTYELGELFVLGLHPERIAPCRKPLSDTLAAARRLAPSVWIARLDEIANWWRARAAATVQISDAGDHQVKITVEGPPGVTVLARGVQVQTATAIWANNYRQVGELSFSAPANKRPFIGVAPSSSPRLTSFLRQQGYVVETGADARACAFYIEQADLPEQDERAILSRIEQAEFPLVRLGRWPNGARSALCVTGDIDALTLWDYGLRLMGR